MKKNNFLLSKTSNNAKVGRFKMFSFIRKFNYKVFNSFNALILSIYFMINSSVIAFADNIPNIETDGDSVKLTGWEEGGNILETSAKFLNQYKSIVNTITVAAIITLVITAVVFGVQMATSGSNPQKRSTAKTALLYVAVGTAIVGAAWTLISLFINVLL